MEINSNQQNYFGNISQLFLIIGQVIDDQQKINIGERISTLIIDWGMTNITFGELVGVDNSTIGKMRKGEKPPTVEMTLELFTKRDVSADWLLYGIGSKFLKKETGPTTEPASLSAEDLAKIRISLETLNSIFPALHQKDKSTNGGGRKMPWGKRDHDRIDDDQKKGKAVGTDQKKGK